ncbi:hypothetical protein RclHR1_02060018 [Rhizophagus clarus]|uniref:Uncharacterized protein n=1 Tax=Rhizophagus clarus TaxID=94130 RepID=A0A2Z6QTK8_9GLOM|nr:hypothetical protein RclHR1_02060018 [Rhizophagus clarus]
MNWTFEIEVIGRILQILELRLLNKYYELDFEIEASEEGKFNYFNRNVSNISSFLFYRLLDEYYKPDFEIELPNKYYEPDFRIEASCWTP